MKILFLSSHSWKNSIVQALRSLISSAYIKIVGGAPDQLFKRSVEIILKSVLLGS